MDPSSTPSAGKHTWDASHYAKHRPSYPARLLDYILSQHKGGYESVLDLGCGPGITLAQVVNKFDHAYGADVSDDMLAQARKLDLKSRLGEPAVWSLAPAQDQSYLSDASIDLVVSSTAAHWFPSGWWDEMARIVKPGGSVAVWIYGAPQYTCDAIDGKILDNLREQGRQDLSTDEGGESDGKRIAHGMYDDLPLPSPEDKKWSAPIRRKFDVGTPSDPELGCMYSKQTTLAQLLELAKTGSSIVMWQQRNPTLVGTPTDPIERVKTVLYDQHGCTPDTPITFSQGFGTIILHRV